MFKTKIYIFVYNLLNNLIYIKLNRFQKYLPPVSPTRLKPN